MSDVPFDSVTGEILDQPPAPPPPKPTRKRKPKSNGKAHRIPPPADETRRAKFCRLAEQRFGNVVKALHILRKLGRNQGSYDYDDADVEQIQAKLAAELLAACGEMMRRGKPVQTKLFG